MHGKQGLPKGHKITSFAPEQPNLFLILRPSIAGGESFSLRVIMRPNLGHISSQTT